MTNVTGLGSHKSTYEVNASCSNCGYTGTIEVQKGQEVPRRETCPNCGCDTLSKLFLRSERAGRTS